MLIFQGEHEQQAQHCALAKQSKYTRDFSNQVMFSGADHYAKGWIRVARAGEQLMGLTCVRHKQRAPQTVLYFLIVDQAARGRGVGRLLIEDMYASSPHREFLLNCMKDNEPALAFYKKLGWTIEGEALGGAAWTMRKEHKR